MSPLPLQLRPGESGWLHGQINHLEADSADSGFVWLQRLVCSIGLARALSVSLFRSSPPTLLTMDPMTDELNRIIDPIQLTSSRWIISEKVFYLVLTFGSLGVEWIVSIVLFPILRLIGFPLESVGDR
ncbi:hypothetical protein ASPTUDRAFT_650007 [Aspergillus tubingensis CBS 134.48]|uniref:Uncharacterized protein n=1 Tax=Aspergillus tubingensis (strain CBS 134.48) TaxID=767770 RepID=A0A1L9N4L4_ASPTC|nr:hypothetical protein ASPTUDRAFT_650007 [Aspergillus tubingensis CBS 134.48]